MPHANDPLPIVRTRLTAALLSISVIALELALMRSLSLRFWDHFAYMVISVALLGFGASGAAIALLSRRILPHRRVWICALSIGYALSIPLASWVARAVPLDIQFLAWDVWQVAYVFVIELLMFAPFLLAGAAMGVILTDRPERIGGHYAANLIGSGAGAIAAVGLMHVLSGESLQLTMAMVGFAAGAIMLPWRPAAIVPATWAAVAAILLCLWAPAEPIISQYKMLSYLRSIPGTETIHQARGPLGRIDVVANPSIHHAPGVSVQYTGPVPPHVLMLVDGDQPSPIYDCSAPDDWRFADQTTRAAAYHIARPKSVLIIGAGGGVDLGLASYHRTGQILALEMNQQVIEAMQGPLANLGGRVYNAPGVTILRGEGRGYLAGSDAKFDLIQLPPLDAMGASGAGLHASHESYLYTVEAVSAMLEHLTDGGMLCITRWARTPPRDGLRIFDTAAAALRRAGLEPTQHLAMIRSWATVTIIASSRPLKSQQTDRLREFCGQRGFDLCYLPALQPDETNRYHVLDRAYYFEGACALLGPDRQRYLDQYLFQIAAATDDKPYFYHFLRLRSLAVIAKQLKARSRAFLEVGHLMLIAALAQSVVLAAVLILLPLAPGIRGVSAAPSKVPTCAYFLLLGAGFMLLEMGFLQKLILYLAHPIYSAAVVIGSFLIFAGVGSGLGGRWGSDKSVGTIAPACVVIVAGAYLAIMDRWLALTAAQPVAVRMMLAAMTIAPLAFAMGHMFPAGLRAVRTAAPMLVPWAWAVNGFASVVATVAAPLVAMTIGFRRLTLLAIVCYALAGVLFRYLPSPSRPSH